MKIDVTTHTHIHFQWGKDISYLSVWQMDAYRKHKQIWSGPKCREHEKAIEHYTQLRALSFFFMRLISYTLHNVLTLIEHMICIFFYDN